VVLQFEPPRGAYGRQLPVGQAAEVLGSSSSSLAVFVDAVAVVAPALLHRSSILVPDGDDGDAAVAFVAVVAVDDVWSVAFAAGRRNDGIVGRRCHAAPPGEEERGGDDDDDECDERCRR